jgi:hypothetical protein
MIRDFRTFVCGEIGVLMGLVACDPEAKSRVAAFEGGPRELG